MNIEINGTTLPVDPRFVPVCTLDHEGKPALLSGGGGGGGNATAGHQETQIELADKTLLFQCGEFGSEIIADAGSLSGSFTGFRCLEDCVIAAITSTGPGAIRGAASLVSRTLPAGTSVWGLFTALTLTSGCVQLFDRVPQ